MTFKLDTRQFIKLTIYSLLLVNFFFYIADDIRIASYTMKNGGSILTWTRSFATTIDESAWFILLFLFELETYLLSDETQSRSVVMKLMYGVRAVCYVFLIHSVYAFSVIYLDLMQVMVIPAVSNLCELVSQDVSFTSNLAYTDLDVVNCLTLSTSNVFYFTEPGLVVTDIIGLALEKNLALVDIMEVLVWLVILLTIEVMVWFQDRSITRGSIISIIRVLKYVLYSSLWCMAAYWAYLGHWRFAWDETLWIVGFFSIEMNVSEWKREIEEGGG